MQNFLRDDEEANGHYFDKKILAAHNNEQADYSLPFDRGRIPKSVTCTDNVIFFLHDQVAVPRS